MKSFSRCGVNSNSTYSLSRRGFQPNFHSDAYKEQAKEIFRRRMDYNPRESASKTRER
jgi:hypothetical protein